MGRAKLEPLSGVCAECGEAFLYARRHRGQRFCSRACAMVAEGKRRRGAHAPCLVTTKVCPGCGLLKLGSEFASHAGRRPDGLSRVCRACRRQSWKAGPRRYIPLRERSPEEREKALAAAREQWARSYPKWDKGRRERHNARVRRSYRRCAERLSDGYVRKILEIGDTATQDVIEAKRVQLQVHREIRRRDDGDQ